MNIERVDTLEEFHRLRPAWNIVYRSDVEAQFFLSWAWLAGVLESHPQEWLVLAARADDSEYVGFLPLQHKTIWSQSRQQLRNELHFAGRLFWADYGGIVCLPEYEEEVLCALASHLKQMNWSHIYLKAFRISARRFELFMKPFTDERLMVESLTSVINDGSTNNLISPYVELPDTFDEYLAQKMSSNTRQKTRRFLRKVESSSEYTITTTSDATRLRDVQILEELWGKMWKPLKGSETRRLSRTYGMIVKRGLDDGLVHMQLLWHGDTAVGVHAYFVDREKSRLLFFVAGRDEARRDLPIGLILHSHAIRWAIENGIRTYDFLRGNEPYKYSFGVTDVRLQYPLIRTKTGINLNGKLDSGCLMDALGLADDFAKKECRYQAMIACCQILATWPRQETAKRLLTTLLDAS